MGFQNHLSYGSHFNWSLGSIRIPKLLQSFDDWACLELILGKAYPQLPEEQREEVSSAILSNAFAQFSKPTEDGAFLLNPEFHGGNILIGKDGVISLVDCGLIARIKSEDLNLLWGILSGFRKKGLLGAASSILASGGIGSLERIDSERLGSSLDIMTDQLHTGIPPELLISALGSMIENVGGPKISAGLDTLFRATQHLAPYIRDAKRGSLGELLLNLPEDQDLSMVAELEALMQGAKKVEEIKQIPKGAAVGRTLSGGRIETLGILAEAVDENDPKNPYKAEGMLRCGLEGGTTRYVKGLMVQQGDKWLDYNEYLRLLNQKNGK